MLGLREVCRSRYRLTKLADSRESESHDGVGCATSR